MVRSMPGHGCVRVRKPPPVSSRRPLASTSSGTMPGKGMVAEPGLVVTTPGSGVIMMPPVSVCHQVSTMGQRPPPMCSWYQIQASGLIGSPTVPSSRRVERSCRVGMLGAPLHEGADRGRRGVEDGDAVSLDDPPEAVALGPVGRALVHQDRGAVGERAVDDVGMPGDPADVGGAPEDVLVLQVEDVLGGRGDVGEVAAGGVDDALGLSGGARGVEDEEQVLGVHRLGRAGGGLGLQQPVPPVIAAFLHLGARLRRPHRRRAGRTTMQCRIDGVSAMAASANRLSGRSWPRR